MFTIKSSSSDFPKSSGKRYKVIVNAGGGLFGYIITNLMSYLDFDLYSKIDIVAGTSIGGILTLAYSLTNDYKSINEMFKRFGPEIFSKKNLMYYWSGPKYKNENLKVLLKKLFNDLKLSDIKNNVVITSTDYTLCQPRIFENINLKPEQDLMLADIALCTSAAPTYFNAQEIIWNMFNYNVDKIPLNERILLLTAFEKDAMIKNPKFKRSSVIFDGGMLENIPIISTYTTLHNELGVEPKDIDMFVIGTGNSKDDTGYSVYEVNKWSILKVLTKLIVPYVTDSNEQTSVFWGLQMGFNSFTYYNPINVSGSMDNPNVMNDIKNQCLEHKDEFISEITAFLNK